MNPRRNNLPETAIILAAGSVPPALSAVFGRTSSAMVPINGRPTIHWILSYLHEIGIRRVILGLRDSEIRLPKFVRQTFGRIQEISYEPISEDRGPGYTLLKCLERLAEGEACLIVLGDTVFQFPKEPRVCFDESFVLTAPVQDASRWCLAEVGEGARVKALADKPESNPDSWPALIGVYFLHSCTPAISALQELCKTGAGSLQLRHALEPYIHSGHLRAYPAGEWFDCGNIDFLNSSRRRLLQARSFNTIQIDELRGTITKRSEHRGKFLNEINYYRLLPRDLATFFPRLVDFGLEAENTYLTLEYYGYPTLSEAWVFEEFEASYWTRIFALLVQVIDCFAKYSVDLLPEATFEFYWLKTLERVASFSRQQPEFKELVEASEVRLNDQTLLGWPALKPKVEAMLGMAAAHPHGQIIHGDLCFTNILYDPVSRLCKFIDPRGSFGDSGIYGDARYDVAKLLHSLDGGYDFFVHDMFVLKQKGMEFQLQQFFPVTRPAVLRGFAEVFGAEFDLKEVQLLEGLLFVSMCTLHKGYPRRQTGMFLTGLAILNRVLGDENFY
jgi:dTDP-glucose pyrophosphorylase